MYIIGHGRRARETYPDRRAASAEQMPFYAAQLNASSVVYMPIGENVVAGGNENAGSYLVPRRGIITDLLVKVIDNGGEPPGAGNTVYQVRKNGADVGPTLSVPIDSQGVLFTLTLSIPVVAGDFSALQVTTPNYQGFGVLTRTALLWTAG